MMNVGIEAEQGHDRGIATLGKAETRTSCRDFEERRAIRIPRNHTIYGFSTTALDLTTRKEI